MTQMTRLMIKRSESAAAEPPTLYEVIRSDPNRTEQWGWSGEVMTDNAMTENSQEWKMENRTMTDGIAEVNTMGQDTDRQVKSSQVK